jgi:hypothetical protein
MEGDMPQTIKVSESIALLMWHLAPALRRLLEEDSQQSSALPPPELMKRFELLLQCGF